MRGKELTHKLFGSQPLGPLKRNTCIAGTSPTQELYVFYTSFFLKNNSLSPQKSTVIQYLMRGKSSVMLSLVNLAQTDTSKHLENQNTLTHAHMHTRSHRHTVLAACAADEQRLHRSSNSSRRDIDDSV